MGWSGWEISEEGVTIYGAASKDIDEVAKVIGSFIFNIDEYIIAIIRDKESETDEEAAGNTTEGVTNAVQMEEEIIPWMMLLLSYSLFLPYLVYSL